MIKNNINNKSYIGQSINIENRWTHHKSELNEKEIYYINKYNSMNNGYNLCEGGNGIRGYRHTKEEIEKMRMIQNPKTVLQIDSQLNIVNKWHGTSHISKELGYSKRNIDLCCNMEYGHKTAYGYYWFYEEDYINDKINWDYYLSEQKIIYDGKKVVQKDLNGNIISTFISIMDAHRKTKINRQSIQYCLQGKQKYAKGFIFEYI